MLLAAEPGARELFWRLPATIFENTVPGLSESEKAELLTQGATEHWVVRRSSPDMLEITESPGAETTVLVRVFRAPGYVLAAIGTDSGPVCSTELWRLDARGGAEPVDTPPEPDILDFFAPGARIPPDVTASMPFCVRPGGLEVCPLFWTSTGLAHVPVDNAVFYVWTGTRFSKRIVSLRPEESPSIPARAVWTDDQPAAGPWLQPMISVPMP